jgi:hypothetical protein
MMRNGTDIKKSTILSRGEYRVSLTIVIIAMLMSMVLSGGCGSSSGESDSDSDTFRLADLSNPFIGKWQSYIPSAGLTLIFDYKTDGTFDYEMVGVPADEGGKGTGCYIIYGDNQVSHLDFEGVATYKFVVVDDDTISVTELEPDENGELVPGNTTPFTRVK